MIEYLLWAVTFISLWLSLFWIGVLFSPETQKNKLWKELPSVTIAIPVWNGGKKVLRTISSLKALDYPKNKIQIIVVDDGSIDDTAKIISSFIEKEKLIDIKLISHKENLRKGATLNTALKKATGEFFCCMDADSTVDKYALKHALKRFSNDKIGAVIPAIHVENPSNAVEHTQRIEYILNNLIRGLMAKVDTLFLTHGVLTVFRTVIVRNAGGFDSNRENITEDMEIALKLRSKGFSVAMAPKAIGYTKVPSTFRAVWRQRVRWFRGFMYNYKKYFYMVGNKKYSFFGTFQLPLNLVAIFLLVGTIALLMYSSIDSFVEFIIRILTIPGYFSLLFSDWPSINQIFLSQKPYVLVPLVIASALGIYILIIAHLKYKEKITKYIWAIWLYLFVYPYVAAAHWIAAAYHEIIGSKRKW